MVFYCPFILYPLPPFPFPSKSTVQLCLSTWRMAFAGSSSPPEEATISYLHLQYCTEQLKSKSWIQGRRNPDSPKVTDLRQTLGAHRGTLSRSHFLLAPQRLELPDAPQQHPGLHSLMWFGSCDSISHCDRLCWKPLVWLSATRTNHFCVRRIFWKCLGWCQHASFSSCLTGIFFKNLPP